MYSLLLNFLPFSFMKPRQEISNSSRRRKAARRNGDGDSKTISDRSSWRLVWGSILHGDKTWVALEFLQSSNTFSVLDLRSNAAYGAVVSFCRSSCMIYFSEIEHGDSHNLFKQSPG